MKLSTLLVGSAVLLCLAHEALADKTYVLATGRRDPRMYAIDLEKALRPENNNTPNAIVSRSKVALDGLDGRPLGDSGQHRPSARTARQPTWSITTAPSTTTSSCSTAAAGISRS